MSPFTITRSGEERIGVLAESTGCPVETIRYYERIGLLRPPLRTAGGHRVYDESHRRRLTFVLRGRELGFSLEEIRELADLADQENQVCAAAEGIARRHIGSIKARIADLVRMQEALERLARNCNRGRRSYCPILESLSAPTENGREGIRSPRSTRDSRSR